MSKSTDPIGVFDSGVGGLSVVRHLLDQLPHEDLIYVADQANVPYGQRSAENIFELSHAIALFLLHHNAKAIVIACNTASAAALSKLRETFPLTPFIGMEPAVKPGAEATYTGKVGVLATAGTFESQRYADLMARFAQNVQLVENSCMGLVELIEKGSVDSAETYYLLQTILHPMLNAGCDTFVLGCTHYPFVMPLIKKIVGENAVIIDPAPAIVKQTSRVLAEHNLLNDSGGRWAAYTTGNVENLSSQIANLLALHPQTHSLQK